MNLRFVITCLLGVLGLLLIGAQNMESATVQVAEHPDFGTHLVDSQGLSLYLYLEDSENTSNCYDACAGNWHPLVVESQPTAGENVNTGLLGTAKRKDGATQVTYNGHPLYTFIRDEEPGDVNGQGVGNLLYLVSPEGESIREAVARELEAEVDEALFEDLMDEGEQIFANICSTCHGDEGGGRVGPPLDGNRQLSRASFVVKTVLFGRTSHGMPSFGDQFSDRQVAAIATFVRNSWSNDYGSVSPKEVSELR